MGQAMASFTDCQDCVNRVTPVADAIVALGAVVVGGLTIEDEVVLSVADLFDATPASALQLIRGVAAAISRGTGAVAQALCAATGNCD